MNKILGLDVGTTSIGWAFLHVGETPLEKSTIIKTGCRIVPLTTNEESEYIKGQAATKNRERTLKRGSRRNLQRYRLRRHLLVKVLQEAGLLPGSSFFALSSLELYGLRDKAVSQPISLHELGRILLHLNQKRGYHSSRKTNVKENDGKYLASIRENVARLSRNEDQPSLTIGQYFYSELKRNRLFRIKKKVFNREMYVAEFDRIWHFQSGYHPMVLTDTLRNKLRNQIIFYQRPLKRQKHLVSKCRLEPGNAVTPRSNPLFQRNKIWQELNNLRIITEKTQHDRSLTLSEKQLLYEVLNQKEKLSSAQILQLIGYSSRQGIKLNKEKVQGNLTRVAILDAFKQAGINRPELLEFNPTLQMRCRIDKQTGEEQQLPELSSGEEQPLYKLWHLLFSVDDQDQIINALSKHYGFTNEQARLVAGINFTTTFSSISSKAIRRIQPFLEEGLMYAQACQQAGYKHADYLTREENRQRLLADQLPLCTRNELRNPVVEKILNQVINLVNAILADPALGRPDEIRVELGRELKQNAKQREDMFKQNNLRNKEHQQIEKRLRSEFGIRHVSRSLIEKFKLYQECDGISFYTGKPMALADVLTGNGFDVDHILPQSRLFDDSFTNKVLVEEKENRQKNNQTAIDYMQSKGAEELEAFQQRVKTNIKISEAKRKKLLMSGDKVPDDFISRQIRETQYISREVLSRLKTICRNVHATSGSVTDYLRHIWGLDQVLQSLNIERYRAAGQVRVTFDELANKHDTRIEGWSKRDDHRHHAIDAIVIACTKQTYIQQLNTLNQTHEHYRQLKQSGRHFPLPWPNFLSDVTRATSQILISFKSGKKVGSRGKINPYTGKAEITPRGQLHKENVYGKISVIGKPVPLNSRFSKALQIVNPHHRALVIDRLKQNNDDPQKAFRNLSKNPIWTDASKTKALLQVRCYEEEYVIKYSLNKDFTVKHAESIVDPVVKKVVQERLAEFGDNPREAFRDLENNPVWLYPDSRVAVESVRCFTGIKEPLALHTSPSGKPIDYVQSGNNHHVMLYMDENGEIQEKVVSFWEAVERKRTGLPVIDRTSNAGKRLLVTMQINEMFVFGLTMDQLKQALDDANYRLISQHLYRVQKLTRSQYYFRHHLETKLDDSDISKEMKRFIAITSTKKMSGIKVKIDVLGSIVKVGD